MSPGGQASQPSRTLRSRQPREQPASSQQSETVQQQATTAEHALPQQQPQPATHAGACEPLLETRGGQASTSETRAVIELDDKSRQWLQPFLEQMTAALQLAAAEGVKQAAQQMTVALQGAATEGIRQAAREAFAAQRLEALEQLSVTPSNASSGQVKKAAGRLQKRIHPGILFPLPPHKDSLPEFSWPLHPTKRTEDEVAGYPTALDFVSDHCMPTSLTAMLKEEDLFLECLAPEVKLHLHPGATDIVVVLEEAGHVLQEGPVSRHLIYVTGLIELKTCAAFKAKRNMCMAQTAIEHLSAAFMLDALLSACQCPYQHTFVSVGTDLNKNWVVYQSRGSNVLVYDQFPLQLDSGRLSAAAAATVKATLTKAAANMRKIGGWLASPPTGASHDDQDEDASRADTSAWSDAPGPDQPHAKHSIMHLWPTAPLQAHQ